MPSISTLIYPIPAYVRVEVNWADVPSATGVAVYRVDCATGVRTALRPYVSFDSDFLSLSCGYGIFWDTEPPLDVCVYYCTTAVDAAGNTITTATNPGVVDSWSRTLVDSWGSPDVGPPYVLTGGTNPGNYDVNGGKGKFTIDSVAVLRTATTDAGFTGQGAYVTVSINATAATSSISSFLALNQFDLGNYYEAQLMWRTDGTVILQVGKRDGGSLITLATSGSLGTYASGTEWTIRGEAFGSLVRAKAYPTVSPEPSDWTLSTTNVPLLTQGTQMSLLGREETGNTNGTIVMSWDNLIVYNACQTTMTVEQCTDNLVVASNNEFRLGDPVRPCNDVILKLTDTADPNCVPTQGIFFANMSTEETFAGNTGVFTPVNDDYPIVTNRRRLAGQQAALTVVTRTFPDRDAMRRLNAAGSALFLRSPAVYGTNDRYMVVADVSEARPMSDHKIQPRAVSMPHAVVRRPVGPSQGVCGTRVRDLCDIYPTLDALAAAGLTWADVLRGKASTDTPLPAAVERTWTVGADSVNSTYANWTGVQAGNTDWDDLETV